MLFRNISKIVLSLFFFPRQYVLLFGVELFQMISGCFFFFYVALICFFRVKCSTLFEVVLVSFRLSNLF